MEPKKEGLARSQGFTHTLTTSWHAILESWKLTLLAVVNDIVFFFLFSWLATWTVITLSEPLDKIYGIAGENISTLAKNLSNEEATSVIISNYEAFMAAYYSILKTAALFLVGAFALWVIFQFFGWFIAHLIAEGKKRFGEGRQARLECVHYFKRFFLASTAAMIAVTGILYASMWLSVQINVSRLGSGPQAMISMLVALLLMAILYALCCGYAGVLRTNDRAGGTAITATGITYALAVTHIKQMLLAFLFSLALIYGSGYLLALVLPANLPIGILFLLVAGITYALAVTHIKQMLPAFLFSLALIYGSGYLLSLMFPANLHLGILFGLLVAGPSFTFSRVLMIVSGKK